MKQILGGIALATCLEGAVYAQSTPQPASATPQSPTKTPSPFSSDPPSQTPSIGGSFKEPECFTNTTIMNDWFLQSDPFVQKEVIVCENTVINIGYPDGTGGYDDGQMEPITPRRYSAIKCGADGSLNNNCTIIGGRYQFITTVLSYVGETSENILVQGFTFKDATISSVLGGNPGDITFKDCVFSDFICPAPFMMLNFLPGEQTGSGRELAVHEDFYDWDRRSRLRYVVEDYVPRLIALADEYSASEQSEISQTPNDRQLQVPVRQLVTLEDVVIKDNSLAPRGPTNQFGFLLVVQNGNDLTLRNVVFQNNDYGDPSVSLVGFAIQTNGKNELKIYDSCFLDNNFIGLAPIRADVETQVSALRNYGTLDSGLACQFVGFLSDSSNSTEVNPSKNTTCINFDSKTCDVPGYPTPSPPPTNDKSIATRSTSAMVWLLVTLILAAWL